MLAKLFQSKSSTGPTRRFQDRNFTASLLFLPFLYKLNYGFLCHGSSSARRSTQALEIIWIRAETLNFWVNPTRRVWGGLSGGCPFRVYCSRISFCIINQELWYRRKHLLGAICRARTYRSGKRNTLPPIITSISVFHTTHYFIRRDFRLSNMVAGRETWLPAKRRKLSQRRVHLSHRRVEKRSDILLRLLKPLSGLFNVGDYWNYTLSTHLKYDLGMSLTTGDLYLFVKPVRGVVSGLMGA